MLVLETCWILMNVAIYLELTIVCRILYFSGPYARVPDLLKLLLYQVEPSVFP